MVQVSVPLVPTGGTVPQAQPAGITTDWNVVPGGSGSDICVLAASSGPSLETVMV